MPDTLATNTVDEIIAFPVVLNDRWRVVDDPLQRVLQYRDREIRHSVENENPKAWAGKHYCRTSTALKRCIGEHCGEVDPQALAFIDTWPDWHV